jgi:hypothetical protein
VPGRFRWREDLLTWPDIGGRARNPAGFKQDVMAQFLAEAVVLSSLGGMAGITIGSAASIRGSKVLEVAAARDQGLLTRRSRVKRSNPAA